MERNYYLEYGDSSSCYGCGQCVINCPVNAIEWEINVQGFRYPKVNSNCIECGKCRLVCPFEMIDFDACLGPIYQVAHKNRDVLLRSQSGGMFTAISDVIIDAGGVVYGSVINTGVEVVHSRAENKEQRNRMCRSKYVQSIIHDEILLQLKNDIYSGRFVLFTGTPCQCASIKKNYGKFNNLIICDFLCHGVPSPAIWREYVKRVERLYNDTVVSAVFRHKINEYQGRLTESFKMKSGDEHSTNDYTTLFYSHLAHRESCFSCQFAGEKRYSDITIGGFLEPSDFETEYDSSMVILNTEKGLSLFQKAGKKIHYQKSEMRYYPNQPCLYHPVRKPDLYSRFWEDFSKGDFDILLKEYATDDIKTKYRIRMSDDCKQVCIVNAHWSNRGDEGALRTIINAILREIPDTIITVIFKDRTNVKGFPYSGRVRHFVAQFLPENLAEVYECIENGEAKSLEMKKEIDCIRNSDLVIYSPGGAVIADKFWWRKQIEYLTPFICADNFGIPIVVAAPSMGPFEDIPERNVLRAKWLNMASKVIVREPMSASYLKKIGVFEKVITTIDTAFYDDPPKELCERTFAKDKALVSFFLKYDKVVGVTLSDFSWHVVLSKKEGLQENLDLAIRNFIKTLNEDGMGVILIPQLFGNQNDIDYLKTYATSEDIFVLSDSYDTYFQQFLISKCFAVVGMRYHSCIFSAKAGVPFLALGYEEKMYGFMENWGLEEYLIKVQELDIKTLFEGWDKLINSYESYRNKLIEHREIWRQKSNETIRSVIDAIKTLPRRISR